MLWSFLIASILIELTPGPNMTWLAVLGAARGRLPALSAVAGIALGLSVAAAIAGVGLTALFTKVPALFYALRWAGTLYLLYLAWEAWHDAAVPEKVNHQTSGQSFLQGLISNILNPKAYLFYAAVLPQFIDSTKSISQQIVLLSAIYVAVATSIHAIIAILAGSVAAWLHASPMAKTIRKTMATLIVLAAAWFFYSTQVTQ
jgi:threonine/homoserine/homoserine lactone efflux protein